MIYPYLFVLKSTIKKINIKQLILTVPTKVALKNKKNQYIECTEKTNNRMFPCKTLESTSNRFDRRVDIRRFMITEIAINFARAEDDIT